MPSKPPSYVKPRPNFKRIHYLGSGCLAPRENTSAAKTGTLGGGMVHEDVASPMAPKTLLLPRVGVAMPVEGHFHDFPVTMADTFC